MPGTHALERVRSRARRAARTVAGPVLVRRRRERLAPLLSVVMPVYDVEPYLREALDSVLAQDLGPGRDLELIAVDDGSTDGSLGILREYERADPRVRVLTQPNSGQGIARNRGTDEARGPFLTFVDSDDTIPPGSFGHLVDTLEGTGSDFAMGGIRRMRYGRFIPSPWRRTVHGADRLGTTIDAFPEAMQNIIACNRVFRTAFWRERVGGFRGGIAYEDHVPMLAAYLRAERFDVLSQITYNWRIREDTTSSSQQKADLRNLRDRVEVKEEAFAMVRAEASPFVHDVWVARCLEVDLPMFVARVFDADATYRGVLAAAYRVFLERATDRAWERVRVFSKVRAQLVAEERWDDLEEANDWFLGVGQLPPTTVVDGVLVADLPTDRLWARDLPSHIVRTSVLEAYFEGVVDQVAWGDEAIVLGGWMRHRSLHVAQTPELAVTLRSGSRELPLAVEHRVVPAASLWSPTPYADCAKAGFRVAIPYAALVGDEPWVLEGTITVSGISSSGRFLDSVPGSPAREPGSRVVQVAGDSVRVEAARDLVLGVSLRAVPVEVVPPAPAAELGLVVHTVGLEGDHLVVALSGAGADALGGLTLRGAGVVVEPDAKPDDAGVLRFPLAAARFGGPPRPLPAGDYELALAEEVAAPAPDLTGELPRLDLGSTVDLSLGVGDGGRLALGVRPPLGSDELGGYHQRRLQDGCRTSTLALTDTVLLASWHGAACADSQRAIDDELARVRPGLTRLWAVADGSVEVPAGARAVQVGSAAWYDAIATSRVRSSNTCLGPWVPRRPGQVHLQTFAGQPFEAMGLTLWRSRQYPAGRVRHEIADVHREWDLILATSDETAEYYRQEFEYAGPILVSGQPRTDRLVTADAAQVRAEVLGRLGVPDSRTVVLWSPTVRDPATGSLFERLGIDPLDVGELARRLGPDHVVLSRVPVPVDPGHAARVVDVSAYPWPDDLVIAADLAVLDYSSLRLDWALTGKPVVFFVPDLEPFFALRPPLFDFAESAPGPLLTTTAAVAEALAEPRAWTDRYATATTAVNERFNRLHDGRAAARVVAALLDEEQAWRSTTGRGRP